ncbi:NAD-dependent epimerase/dehydratase family protein [Pelomonas sp. V22]|uniref:NAD-dependent epimerase/dehydratase family protein n=1 Tax=Pelomonas sp. V22 TaxID=2822139 RepID=UPI0024A96374|nr:NAD-dependent epimerase/dehydratase family protein [Pelomonas sp. V22]MDI4631607.1 NAD-dependent epimerase/dehydratase family protein [Pelomonas sp. V22]
MILVTGATGFLGKRVCRLLTTQGRDFMRTSQSMGLDLRDAAATLAFFEEHRPSAVINCAAYVGGIQFGSKHPAELFHNNLLMTLSLLAAAQATGVTRIVNPISNCAYPAAATLFKEEEFWDGPLHDSVMVYGFVRKASWVGSWAYQQQYGLDVVNLILSNMYGPDDHFEEERSHAMGALIMKIADAKRKQTPQVVVWGSGKPVREWLHVDDGAEALVRGLAAPATNQPVNVGVGQGISIIEMAELIKRVVGYQGELVLDTSKQDGAPYKTVDGTKGAALLGWSPSRDFEQGVRDTVAWYMEHGS